VGTHMDARQERYREAKGRGLILAHHDQAWSWTALSRNKAVDIELVCTLVDKPWNWTLLSANRSISWDDILRHPELPWDWTQISKWARISMVLEHPEKPWSWPDLSMSPNIHLEDILGHPWLPWDETCVRFAHCRDSAVAWHLLQAPLSTEQLSEFLWKQLSGSRDLSVGFVLDNIDRPWDFAALSNNRHLQPDLLLVVQRHPQKPWDWWALSYSNLSKIPIPEWKAATVIQRWWLRLFYDPKSHICHARLLREHRTLVAGTCISRKRSRQTSNTIDATTLYSISGSYSQDPAVPLPTTTSTASACQA